MIKYTLKGSFKNSEKFFEGIKKLLPQKINSILNEYGRQGVAALQSVTPKDSGTTSDSWSYSLIPMGIVWSNSNTTNEGTPIAILLQYGHGTRDGGYVQGRDYINPAVRPIFDKIADACWKEVENL